MEYKNPEEDFDKDIENLIEYISNPENNWSKRYDAVQDFCSKYPFYSISKLDKYLEII